ncbi:S-layer homology domain-containing protein [Paenibacillus sp. PAMC21692]|uniref:S-layer homology domain-containing protein n=1 Tax=Paenibacillus sp. PAMC21692 TaxID=2762320 RepID=UPI00164CE4F2|nr:S-layer homology domain-containing protein [Paenibacillus sp. PAMC21692]QNK58607.1 S-layer homology domain-containing protein [Paenibacillus sp. PAMC21692]
MKKRIIGAMLGLSMMMTLLPAAAFAAGTGAMAGTGGIADGNIIYYGQYTEGGISYEMPWLVLDADKTNTNTGGAFLISKYLLGSTPFEAVWDGDDNDGQVKPNEWQNSDAQTWSQNFAGSDYFTAAELSAMLATTKTDGPYMEYGASELKSEKAFFLSGEEAATYFQNDNEREAAYITNPSSGNTGWWWLRSPYGDKPHNAGVVSVVQRHTRVSYADGARPAINLSLSSVLFSSAAQGGKQSGTVGAAALKTVSAGTPSEWKLTLRDNSRNFKAERTEYNSASKVMTIGYTGATVGANDYISAAVIDQNGSMKYYGNIVKPQSASGSAKIDLSGVILGAGDKLYVFSEAANGNKKTDYASALQEMSINGGSSGGGNVVINDPEIPVKEEEEEPTSQPVWENQFTDVKEADWFYDTVKYVYEKGLMKGVSDTAFSPAATTKRAMLVTILYRLEGSPAVGATHPFSDVAAGKYYEDAVIWSTENKIVGGYGNGKFGPEDPITREQMAAILYRYASFKGYDVSARADLSTFVDAASVSVYAKDAMAWANAKGLILGYDAKLTPKSNALRSQMAAIIQRFLDM